jgi:hypothetical protein
MGQTEARRALEKGTGRKKEEQRRRKRGNSRGEEDDGNGEEESRMRWDMMMKRNKRQ